MSRSTTTLQYLSLLICLITLFFTTESFSDQTGVIPSFESPLLVKKDQRTPIIATEFGEISSVQIGDGYHLQFITLEPNSLLLPLLLHSDMVFFVHTGSGVLNWIDDEKEKTLELRRGDVYRLHSGAVFYLHSNEVPEKFRVYAIFDGEKCFYDPCLGAYSSIRDLLLGFDDKLSNQLLRYVSSRLFQRRGRDHLEMRPIDHSNKKKSIAYNVFEADPDFENDYGQSIVVDKKDLHALKHSGFGVFMVTLTKGSMMGPHWNPRASEISIVLRGEGMIRVPNQQSLSSCKSKSERFLVEEGDVFVVPKFHPMTQLSFENSSFVFMGLSTSVKKNHPQFLVGKSSVLKVLDPGTVKRLLEAQKESMMFECVSCAEGELAKLMKEIEEKTRREEEAKRREEEKRRREEEEIERRMREEEEAMKREEERKREEESAKRREEEKKRREEEAEETRKREEEEAKRREEERKRHEEEAEEVRRREEEREKEEEMAKKREEERQKKEREEQERKRREEEAMRKREEERKRQEEAAKRAEEERRKREEEEQQKRLPPPQPPYTVNKKNVVM